MQRRVEKREQAEHPPVLNEAVPSCETAKRRDGERGEEKPQRPDARLELQRLGGIGTKQSTAIQPRIPEISRRQQRYREEDRLDERQHGAVSNTSANPCPSTTTRPDCRSR